MIHIISIKNAFKYITSIAVIMCIFLCMHVYANPATIDPGFDTKVPVGFDQSPSTLTIQNDNKILIGGGFTTYKGIPSNRIIRLHPDGTKDYSFDIGAGFNNTVYGLAIQNDNKIVVGGTFTSYSGVTTNRIVRLHPDGTRDASFTIGSGFNNDASVLVIQDDGKILVGGNFTTYNGLPANRIIRLNPDGTRDTSFTIGEGFNNIIFTIEIQNDGKILVGGNFTTYSGANANRIIRLHPDGTKDASFDIGSGFNGQVNTLILQDDESILVGGRFTNYSGSTTNSIIRLHSDGTKDTNFTMGNGFNNTVNDLAIQGDGKIIVDGRFTNYSGVTSNRIIRLHPDGTKDTSFTIGNGFDNTVQTIKISNEGTIFVVGSFTLYSGVLAKNIVCLHTNGTRNMSFDIGDGFDNSISVLAVQDDGKIIVGGYFISYNGVATKYIVRLNPDGTRDSSFTIGSGFNNSVSALAIQDDGKILVGGNFTSYNGVATYRIIRLNPDGTRDASFTIGGGFNNSVSTLVIQNDGKILVGGNFTSYSGVTTNKIIRLNTNGTRDASFTIGSGLNGSFNTLAIQDDGKIIVGGNFTSYSGVTTNRIIRLNTDGTRDFSFTIGEGFNNDVRSLAIQDDGKILVGGYFSSYSGVATNYIIRLNPDGTKDTNFIIGGGFGSQVNKIIIQDDGKIIVGGYFTSYNGIAANRIIRLNTYGTKDYSFDILNGFNSPVSTLALQSGGKILVGGNFTSYNGIAAGYLTSLYGDSDLVILPDSTNSSILVNRFTDKGYVQQDEELIGTTSISLVETNGFVPLSFNVKNQEIKLSVPADTQFKQSNNVTNYSGIISVPITKSISSVNNEEVVAAFKVGSSAESIKLTGGVATLLVPAPGKNIGDPVDIYYSENNGVTWFPQTTTTVINVGGQPFVSFTTNHFTDFAITVPALIGSFVINNDAASTTVTGVTLNISTTPEAIGMRFSNDNSTRSNRVAYATTRPRTLSDGTGTKTVYAQFDADGDEISDVQTSDTILYNFIVDGGNNGTSCPPGSYCGDIQVQVISGYSYCEYGTTLDFGWTGHSYTARSLITGFQTTGQNNAWFCEDKQGLFERGLTIASSAIENISTHNPLHTIPASSVFIKNPPAYRSQGVCTHSSGASLNERINIASSTTILGKVGAQGEGCTVVTDNVSLRVDLAPSQAVGLYSGTLTINLPNF